MYNDRREKKEKEKTEPAWTPTSRGTDTENAACLHDGVSFSHGEE